MEENEDTSIISLKVNPEQRETIIQFINFNAWDLDEMLFKEGSVSQDTNCDDQDFVRTFCIPQNEMHEWVHGKQELIDTNMIQIYDTNL